MCYFFFLWAGRLVILSASISFCGEKRPSVLAYRDNLDPRLQLLLRTTFYNYRSYNIKMADDDLAALNALEKEAKEFDKV